MLVKLTDYEGCPVLIDAESIICVAQHRNPEIRIVHVAVAEDHMTIPVKDTIEDIGKAVNDSEWDLAMEKTIKTKQVVAAVVITLTTEEIEMLAAILDPEASLERKNDGANLLSEIVGVNINNHVTEEMTDKHMPAPQDGKKVMWKVKVCCPRVDSYKCLADILVKREIIANTEGARYEMIRDLMGACYDNNGNLDANKWHTILSTDDYNKAKSLEMEINETTCLTASIEEIK